MYISEEEAKKYPILYKATFTFIYGNKATLDVIKEDKYYYYYIERIEVTEDLPWEPAGTYIILGKLPKDEIINVEV